jgi:hypothetical protein
VGHQFPDLPAWEFSTITNESGATYRVRAVRDGGVTGEMDGEDLDELTGRLRDWAHSIDVGVLIRQALDAVEPLMERAFRAVQRKPDEGSVLDQAGLVDGAEIVIDYIAHREIGLAFDHLLYMIVEPSLPITTATFRALQEVADRLGTEHQQLAHARRLVEGP